MINKEQLAGDLYEVYSNAVGGINYKGDPLPAWEEFRADETKRKQSDAWIKVAEYILVRF